MISRTRLVWPWKEREKCVMRREDSLAMNIEEIIFIANLPIVVMSAAAVLYSYLEREYLNFP